MMFAAQKAKEIRERLMRPPNAVVDNGIDLKRSSGVRYNGSAMRAIEVPAPIVLKPVTLPVVQIAPIEEPELRIIVNAHPVTEIVKAVCAHYKVTPIDVISRRRTADIVRPRQVGMWLARHLTLLSLPAIGRRFDGRDHTTVLHAIDKIDALRKDDPKLQATLDSLMASLAPIPQPEEEVLP